MPSSKSEQDDRRGGIRLLSQELAALGMDLHATLQEEPRFLLDARLLSALHQELFTQLGPMDARAALVQMGFLHGLRDALRVVQRGFGGSTACLSSAANAVPFSNALLPIRFSRPSAGGGGLLIQGIWPDRHEAVAVRAVLGARSKPACAVSAGFTSGWLSGIYDTDLLAYETSCRASDAEECSFQARDASQWSRSDDPSVEEALLALPFAPLRDVVARHMAEYPDPGAPGNDGFEPGAAVVHVWGPVMVIPFSGPEESLRALGLIGNDPGARDVRVVVIDLSGAIIDEGFGAAALEQILESIEGWGAEPILAGVSPLSEPVVAGLEASHLVVSKDLPEAIALGFQVAELQKRR
ncbi:MAG: hypothetical protein GY723_05430 [bacterium]|nr:hypothetical protein [bacterium]MCP5067793.1 hypothetical protein [bacterium]